MRVYRRGRSTRASRKTGASSATLYLLLAASEEKLNEIEPARRHYQKAAELLGDEPATIDGIVFIGLVLYTGAVRRGAGRRHARRPVQQRQGRLLPGEVRGRQAHPGKARRRSRAIDGRDTLKGRTYLLAGAANEKLGFIEPAVKYYCRAKAILGEGITFQGLELKTLKYYTADCGPAGSRPGPRPGPGPSGGAGHEDPGDDPFAGDRRRRRLVPLLLQERAAQKDGRYEHRRQHDVHEHLLHDVLEVLGRGGMVQRHRDGDRHSGRQRGQLSGRPSQSNNWEDQVTYTLSATGGGTLASISLNIDLEVGGGDNAKRRHRDRGRSGEIERHQLLLRILQRAGEEDVHERLRPRFDGDLHPQTQGRPVQDGGRRRPGRADQEVG